MNSPFGDGLQPPSPFMEPAGAGDNVKARLERRKQGQDRGRKVAQSEVGEMKRESFCRPNVTPKRGENDIMERHCQSMRVEWEQERVEERGEMTEDVQNWKIGELLQSKPLRDH